MVVGLVEPSQGRRQQADEVVEIALMAAAETGSPDSARLLLDAGPDARRSTPWATPLTVLAHHHDDVELAQLLIAAGTDPCVRVDRQGGMKMAAEIAAQQQHAALAA